MGTIRQCALVDVAEVADLWARTFHLRESTMTAALAAYLEEIFFSNPWLADDSFPSLVHQDRRGRITGFLGVVPRRMRFRGQTIQVAVASQLMVDRNEPSAFTALEMLRRLFSGRQDLTFSDGANDLSQKLWEAAGGSVAIPFSLTWTRILRPAGYWAGQCKERELFMPFVRVSTPLRKTLDAAAARIPGSPYMFPEPMATHVESEPSSETVLQCLHGMTRGRELQPQYDLSSLSWLLEKAGEQKKHGQLRASVVRNSKAEIVGWHLYYAKRRGVSQVLQFGGKDASVDDVLGSLFRDAWLQGATAISGQVDPKFARQLAKNHCSFTWTGGVLAHSKNREISNAIHRGDAFLSRLDGEWWMRFCDMTEPSIPVKSTDPNAGEPARRGTRVDPTPSRQASGRQTRCGCWILKRRENDMCGIAGLVRFDGVSADPGLLRPMIQAVRHRGPDGVGVYTDRNTGLAHARLSIVDPVAGDQPMHDGTRRLWITFNGEIFNHIELREELIRKGHRFQTHSDTEVILHQYQEKGEDCVHDFNGQWSFAIWDSETRKLFLSRDRFGIQPLFHTTHNGAFLFASEIKSLLAYPGVPREIDPVGLDQIFTFWCTVPPRSIFQGIHELPPGHCLTIENNEIKTRRYWQIDYAGASDGAPSEPAAESTIAARLLELLADATRIRMRADVPVGAYLSGGLDSSLIAALMRQSSGTTMKTFSVAFDDPEFDESRHQEDMGRFLGVERHQIRCGDEDIGRVFPNVIWQTEKPILRTAPGPLYILSNLVRETGHKVVLTGEGSDEILGGYDIFKEAKIRRFWGAQPDSRVRPMLLGRLYPYQLNLQMQSPSYLQAFFRVNAGDLSNAFFSHLPRWQLTSRLKMFFSDEVQAAIRQEENSYQALEAALPKDYFRWDPFCQAQYLEAALLLPGYILSSQGERMAMAHSVETRFPFLDHRVTQFAASIPPSLKMKVLNEKYILKRSAQHLIPGSITRRTKQPYRAPEGKSFFSGGKARDYVESALSPERLRKSGLFDSAAVQRLLRKFREGMAIGIKDNMAMTGIVSTQLVVDQFIERMGVQT